MCIFVFFPGYTYFFVCFSYTHVPVNLLVKPSARSATYIVWLSMNQYMFLFRFGLSNRFDTEFPSGLAGKVRAEVHQALVKQKLH